MCRTWNVVVFIRVRRSIPWSRKRMTKRLKPNCCLKSRPCLRGRFVPTSKNRERLLNGLRAYLMLNLKDRRDAAWLKDWVATDWSVRYAGNAPRCKTA